MSKKIMFNDEFGLTQAVLEGRKTMTRRIFYIPDKLVPYLDIDDTFDIADNCIIWKDKSDNIRMTFEPKYKVGEVIAIAQSYKNIDNYYNAALYRKTSIHGQIVNELDLVSFQDIRRWKYFSGDLMNTSGWTNKMFVKADLMPHHIEITGINIERLQDISDEDCLKEGIEEHLKGVQYGFTSNIGYIGQYPFSTPCEAFSALIDRISGKCTWKRNPFVFCYEFKLID